MRLTHKPVHEAHVAAEVIASELQGNKELASAAFNARAIPGVAYTNPEAAHGSCTNLPPARKLQSATKVIAGYAALASADSLFCYQTYSSSKCKKRLLPDKR